jgi:hypothetical protein
MRTNYRNYCDHNYYKNIYDDRNDDGKYNHNDDANNNHTSSYQVPSMPCH